MPMKLLPMLPTRPFLEHRGVRVYRTFMDKGPVACEFNWRAHQKFSREGVGAEISFDVRKRGLTLPESLAIALMAAGNNPVTDDSFVTCEKAALKLYIDECFATDSAPWAFWLEVPESGPISIENVQSELIFLNLTPVAWRELRRQGSATRIAADAWQRDTGGRESVSRKAVCFVGYRRLLLIGHDRVPELVSTRASTFSEGALCALLKSPRIRNALQMSPAL